MHIKENGRSMVEMLGVLAVIGVLSAGALSGYSKAMFRYRINKTIDEVSQILQNFSEVEQKGFGDVGVQTADEMIKYGIMPNCQKVDEHTCKLPIGSIEMLFSDSEMGVIGEFYINLRDSKSCIAFLSAGWERAMPVEWFNPYGSLYINGESSKALYDPNGVWGSKITELTIERITDACQQCDAEDCSIEFIVRNEQ